MATLNGSDLFWSNIESYKPDIFPTCLKWMPPNHVLFQMANTFLLLSYLSPTGIYGLLYLRSCLTVASIFYLLWGSLVLCSVDTVIWNALFTLINAVYVVIIIYKLHPFIRFPHDVELVYRDLFQPLKVSRDSFRKIFKCTREIQTLKPQDCYCFEGISPADRLSILLSGRLAVMKSGKTLHLIDSHQFLDSPEWFGVGSNETMAVTIMALEESRLIVWHRDKLKLTISDDLYLQAVLDNVLGKDVVKKLLFVTETMGNNNPYSNQSSPVTNEQAKLIVPVRAMDQVVKRNINMNNLPPPGYCFWNLSRITEDTETNV